VPLAFHVQISKVEEMPYITDKPPRPM